MSSRSELIAYDARGYGRFCARGLAWLRSEPSIERIRELHHVEILVLGQLQDDNVLLFLRLRDCSRAQQRPTVAAAVLVVRLATVGLAGAVQESVATWTVPGTSRA